MKKIHLLFAICTLIFLSSSSSCGNYQDDEEKETLKLDVTFPGDATSSISGKTSEDGTQATFTAKLNKPPTTDVTTGLTSSDTGEGIVSPSSLTFTTDNWNANQTVTVTGVNDDVQDGNQTYSIVLVSATSDDTNYSGLNPSDVSVTNLDWIKLDFTCINGDVQFPTNPILPPLSANCGEKHLNKPVLQMYSGKLYGSWYENGEGEWNTIIRVARYNDKWEFIDEGGLNINQELDANNPQLTVFEDKLFVIWSEAAQEIHKNHTIRVKAWDGEMWELVSGSLTSNYNSQKPEFVGLNNKLYAVWHTDDNEEEELEVAMYDGGKWEIIANLGVGKFGMIKVFDAH